MNTPYYSRRISKIEGNLYKLSVVTVTEIKFTKQELALIYWWNLKKAKK